VHSMQVMLPDKNCRDKSKHPYLSGVGLASRHVSHYVASCDFYPLNSHLQQMIVCGKISD